MHITSVLFFSVPRSRLGPGPGEASKERTMPISPMFCNDVTGKNEIRDWLIPFQEILSSKGRRAFTCSEKSLAELLHRETPCERQKKKKKRNEGRKSKSQTFPWLYTLVYLKITVFQSFVMHRMLSCALSLPVSTVITHV